MASPSVAEAGGRGADKEEATLSLTARAKLVPKHKPARRGFHPLAPLFGTWSPAPNPSYAAPNGSVNVGISFAFVNPSIALLRNEFAVGSS